MDIKAFGLGSSPVLSTQKLELPAQPSRDAFYPLSPLPTDEIIDYVEIQSNNYQPAPNRPSFYPIPTDRSALDKGTLIDVWI
jgi:hypothetical protein